jgi:DNA-binding GntR family transcriptional regulator
MREMRSNSAIPDQPTSPKQCREWLVQRIRDLILSGAVRPGEWLRQEKFAQQFGVSHTPVREALKQLSAEGLLEHVPYRGIRVVEISPTDVADLYECRAFVEGMAARYAAINIDEAQLAELRAVFERMKNRLGPRHIVEYRELNRRFHTVIFDASRRSLLVRTLAQIWAAFPSMLWSNFARTAPAPLPGRDKTDVEEHSAILAALEARDPEAAERATRIHIQHAKELLLGVIAGQA